MKDIDIQRIAKLARLEIQPQEFGRLESEMRELAALADALPETEVCSGDDVLSGEIMELREDTPAGSSVSPDALLGCAPVLEKGCISVPQRANAYGENADES